MPRRPILLALAHRRRRRPPASWSVRAPGGDRRPAWRSASRRQRSSGRRSTVRHSTWRPRRASPSSSTSGARAASPVATSSRCSSAKLAEHAADGLAVVGVLTDDPVEPARDFVAEYGATWPTVVDPDKAIKAAYRVVGPAADLLRRPSRGPPLDPGRRADATPTSSASTPGSRRDGRRRRRSSSTGSVKRYGERTVLDGVSLTVAAGRARRAARPERRRQDHDRRDHRGLSPRRRRHGAGPRAGSGATAAGRCGPASA